LVEKLKKIGLVMLLTLITSFTVPVVFACDTATPGYWKNRGWRLGWPTTEFLVGDRLVDDSGDRLWALNILWMNLGRGRGASELTDIEQAWYNLAQKVIAGQLSMLADPHPWWGDGTKYDDWRGYTPIVSTSEGFVAMIEDANYLLNGEGSPVGTRDEMLELASTIDWWLNELDDGVYNP
jgi:hypothetical protein